MHYAMTDRLDLGTILHHAVIGRQQDGQDVFHAGLVIHDFADDLDLVAIEALMVQDDAKTLIELFRAEKDPTMKKIIIQQLSVMDDPDATRAILDVLGQ